ncbi:MAG: hypothetical protein U1F49_05695 [Rubrivivax sp.]
MQAAVGSVHRVQRLDGQRHAPRTRFIDEPGDAFGDLRAREFDAQCADFPANAPGEAADDEHEAGRLQRARFVERAGCRRAAAREASSL